MKACIYCGKTDHASWQCFDKPRQPLAKKKFIKKHGKKASEWVEFRHNWIQNNPPDWKCHYCGKHLTIETLTLDHLQPRSRRPDLRLDSDNVVPSCFECNNSKGSKGYDAYQQSQNAV